MDGKRQLAFAIVKHLKNEVSSGGHDDDTSESLEGIGRQFVALFFGSPIATYLPLLLLLQTFSIHSRTLISRK